MKSFVIASVIILVILAVICTNTILTVQKTDRLLSLSADVKNGSSADGLVSEWQSCRKYFLLSNHRNDIERADIALIQLLNAEPQSDTARTAMENFLVALKIIRNNQQLSLDNIL